MMENPLPALFIVGIYLYFVLKLGPRLMENREPMKMKPVLIIYNACLVVFSTWWVLKVNTFSVDQIYMIDLQYKMLIYLAEYLQR